MINNEIVKLLNNQLNLEFYSANLYLQMSAWCNYKTYEGFSVLLKKHSDEEIEHMKKLFDYICKSGNLAIINEIKAPPNNFKSIIDLFTQTYEHEKFITKNINNIIHSSITIQDYTTFSFLQWYIVEQHEEENLFKTILDKINLIDKYSNGLLILDNNIKKDYLKQ
ncbi:non-heme ferritin [Candidatus Providencia siddallii]|uniref:Ferritin n=1 Tax=Candidatus Providencia siddallii TaxID=1715285 RepID=A0ABM9NP05_9GAMM